MSSNMDMKRLGNALLNTDNEGYLAAKKRVAFQKERREKDRLLESLEKRVTSLEEEIRYLHNKLEELKDDIG